jgi:small subunit ribosomal protein S17
MEKRNLRKERIVAETKRVKHPMYGKFVLKTKKYVAHDEKNDCNEGDTVRIMETRPMSKSKRWRLVEILERAK